MEGGDPGHYGFCHIMRQAVMMIFLIFFYKGQVKSPILHNTRDGSDSTFPLYVILGEDFGYYEACLKTQPA